MRLARRILSTSSILLAIVAVFLGFAAQPARAVVHNTVTTLTVTQPGDTAPYPATLTATVTANGQHLRRGIVTFCDASTRPCIDLAVVGTSAVTSNGTATLKKVFAPGTHTVYAVFNATLTDGRSESGIETIVVSRETGTATKIGKASAGSSVSVLATVAANGGAPFGGGAVSLVRDSDSSVLGSGQLSARAAITTSFAPFAIYPTPSNPSFPVLGGGFTTVVADFNGDGLPDIATNLVGPNDGEGPSPQVFAILLNDSAHPGQFLDGGMVNSGPAGYLMAADLNGDGVLDLVWNTTLENPNGFYSRTAIALGDPAHPGQFLAPYIVNTTATFTAIADVNGDGLLDLLGTDAHGNVYVMFNDSQYPGQFFDSLTYPTAGGFYNSFSSVTVADMNNDGLPDIVFFSFSGSQEYAGVMLNDPGNPGHFLTPAFSSIASGQGSVLADFNRDGLPDLVTIQGGGSVAVQLNNASARGELLPPSVYEVGGNFYDIQGLEVGNFRGAKTMDLIAGYYLIPSDPAHPGQFLAAETLPFPAQVFPNYLSVGDLNGDGYADLVVANPNDTPPITVGTLITQVTQSATASIPNIALSGVHPEFAHVQFAGGEGFLASSSCSIDLSTVIPSDPSLTGVSASAVSSTSESIASSSSGTEEYVSYGTSASLGTVVGPSTPGVPVVLVDLQANTRYYYQVTAVAFASGCTPLVTSAPVASFVTASTVAATSAKFRTSF
jgi:hypothetical protein